MRWSIEQKQTASQKFKHSFIIILWEIAAPIWQLLEQVIINVEFFPQIYSNLQ